MKDSRFIELLNLYVDHQISQAEAAELETEILRSPERRKTYRDYCRMQRACGMLFDRELQQAPASFLLEKSLQETERKITAFPDRRKTGWGTYTAAFGAATALAACLVVVLMRPDNVPVQNENAIASAKTTAPLVVAATTPAPAPLMQTVALTPRPTVFQSGFSGRNLVVARDEPAPAERAAGTEWMQQVQLPPVQRVLVDDMAFETRPTLQQDNRVFRSRRPIQGNVEFTAFQFQR